MRRQPRCDGDTTAWGEAVERQFAPALVFGATGEMQLMQEEIFGPILPVISYEHIEDVINAINASPRPLALYWFGNDEAERDAVLMRTVSGGVCVNDTLLHVAHENCRSAVSATAAGVPITQSRAFALCAPEGGFSCSRAGRRLPCCTRRSGKIRPGDGPDATLALKFLGRRTGIERFDAVVSACHYCHQM
jgi:hypothetical protein